MLIFFFFNDTATTEIYTLSLHDALPIFEALGIGRVHAARLLHGRHDERHVRLPLPRESQEPDPHDRPRRRSEEHTSELQSRQYLVCRLLLEKKKTKTRQYQSRTKLANKE